MSTQQQDEGIVSVSTSNNLSSPTEKNDNTNCSRGLDSNHESIPSKSTRDEYYSESEMESMPQIDPSMPVTLMSNSPISTNIPNTNFGTPVGPRNNEEEVSPSKYTMSLVSDYGYSDDEDAILEMHNIDKDLLPVVHIKQEICDDDMDESISKDYINENINVSSKVTNSSEPLNEENEILVTETHNINKDLLPVVHIKEEVEMIDCDMNENLAKDYPSEKVNLSPKVANINESLNEENEDDIIETERHNIDKDLLPVISIKEEVEIIESDREESLLKESQKENTDFSAKVTNSFGLLGEEKTDAYRWTVDIASGTDDSESDSDDSSSDGFSSSSSSSSDSDSDDEITTSRRQKVKEPVEEPSLDDQALYKLPPIEDLKITVSEEESQPIGTIFSIVDQQVVIQALPNVPPIDLESVLFLENGKQALGKVFDVFGPVQEPLYTVRFNSTDHIKERGFNIGDPVYFAPQTEHTQFVVLSELMRAKGSDASWENNKEPPPRCVDYSDDEQEFAARQQRKQEKLLAEGIPVNEFKPQRKRPRGGGQNTNPFSNSGSRPSRAPMRYAQRSQHHQPWRAGNTRFPRPPMHHHNQNPFGQYDQRNGEYQFGAPPQFPPAGPHTNWHQTGPGTNWMPHPGPSHNWHHGGPGTNWPPHPGPPGVDGPPPPHMGGPPPHLGGPPPPMPPMHQQPPPPYPDASVTHQSHTYPSTSQENWWPQASPSNFYQPQHPPPHGHF